ncbi:MAG: cob(I)yrinic acid a,c-diamide adenosyltransferase [Chloroflexi bacterium]|nr:cob(I)yrinic acid a,c-diamide adenosyltransferase [Chloroflexota bacterium]
MVRLSKIYTKTGDSGQTMLGDGTSVAKDDPRVEAYGAVDEANAAIGVVVASIQEREGLETEIRDELVRVQHDLFDVGADLCVPIEAGEEAGVKLRVQSNQVERLEQRIDAHTEKLEPLDSFALPGGSELAAGLHVARTIVRRAERRVVALKEAGVLANDENLRYINRLSDLLFILARYEDRALPFEVVTGRRG